MKLLPILLFAILAIGLGVMLLNKDAPKDPVNGSNRPFPNIAVTTFDGVHSWNPQIVKGRVSVVNFFASWCMPCAAEMPELAVLKQQFPNLNMVGIAWNDTPETLTKWLQKYGNPYQSVWIDKTGDATIDLGIKGIPETFIIDTQGTIRYHLSGPLTATLRNGEIGKIITELTRESASSTPKPTKEEVREEKRKRKLAEKERKAAERRLKSPMLVGGGSNH